MAGRPSDDEVFALVAAERRALATCWRGLTDEQWATPSLCAGWTVRDVAGHLVTPFEVSMPALVLRLVRCRGDLDRAFDELARQQGARPTDELASILAANAGHRFTPPMAGPWAPLTDVIVHGEDIRRPLGLDHDVAPAALVIALDAMAGGAKGFVPAARVAGLRLEATDLDWATGEGEPVRGLAIDLLLGLLGRAVALDGLEGSGVEVLRSRLG